MLVPINLDPRYYRGRCGYDIRLYRPQKHSHKRSYDIFHITEKKLPKKMHMPTILGPRYFRDRSRYHIHVRRPQKTPRNYFRSILYQDE